MEELNCSTVSSKFHPLFFNTLSSFAQRSDDAHQQWQDEVSSSSSHVDEQVDIVLVSLHVLVFYQPLDLLFDHLFGGQEHVFQDLNQLGLQLCVGNLFPHLQDLDDGLLGKKVQI